MPTLRILGGTAKGRTLQVPDSARPTGARLRKSLFDLLDTRQGGGRFLDLYGGSGAVGLEAASRGYEVTLLDKNPAAVRVLERNARDLLLRVQIMQGEALSVLGRLGSFDCVFVDPPYLHDIERAALTVLRSDTVLSGGLLIIQHPTQLTLPAHEGYRLERRVYGSNVMTLYTRLE